jgi:hypothetical protein
MGPFSDADFNLYPPFAPPPLLDFGFFSCFVWVTFWLGLVISPLSVFFLADPLGNLGVLLSIWRVWLTGWLLAGRLRLGCKVAGRSAGWLADGWLLAGWLAGLLAGY